MHIIMGIDSPDDIIPLTTHGCHEFYCGVKDDRWTSSHHSQHSPNARVAEGTSLSSFKQLETTCRKAAQNGARVFLTLNANTNAHDAPQLLEYCDKAIRCRIDGVIISDIGLMTEIRSRYPELEIHASSLFAGCNTSSLKMLAKMGVKRLILSRHITPEEMDTMARAAQDHQIELEAFILNEGCKNIDAFCRFEHGFAQQLEEVPACCLDFTITPIDMMDGANKMDNHATPILRRKASRIRRMISCSRTSCGICALPHLKKAGITALKIVSRGHPLNKKLTYLALVSQAIKSQEYKRLFETHTGRLCTPHDCYYPSL